MGTEKSAYEQLTWKQRAFVDAYLENGFNATRAAIKAGYSEDSARSIGSENLTKPDIKAALSERMGELAMGPHETLGRLAAIARSDIGEIFKTVQVDVSGYRVEEGSEETEAIPTREVTTIDIKKAIEEGRSFLIKSYSTTQYGQRVELYSQLEALTTIAKVHGLMSEKVEQSGEVVIRVKYEND
jgi:phage terminase small subunit